MFVERTFLFSVCAPGNDTLTEDMNAEGLLEGKAAARQAVREREEYVTRIRHLQVEVDDVRAERDRAERDRTAALQACFLIPRLRQDGVRTP